MADVYATKNGGWDDPTVWNTGVVPSAGDSVYSNNKAITITTDITATSISNRENSPAVAGGSFTINKTAGTPDFTVNADILGGLGNCLVVPGALVSGRPINLTVNGDVHGGNISAGSASGVWFTCDTYDDATLTINGNIYSGIGLNKRRGVEFFGVSGNTKIQTLTINGNMIGEDSSAYGGVYASYGLVYINGNISIRGLTVSNAKVKISGTIIGHDDFTSVNADQGSTLVIDAEITTASNGLIPISGGRWFLESGSIGELQVYEVTPGTFTQTADPPEILTNVSGGPQPQESDVRKGVVYGDKTGTLSVPDPLEVAFGIPIDNTVGKAAINLARLSEITGDQIAAAFDIVN